MPLASCQKEERTARAQKKSLQYYIILRYLKNQIINVYIMKVFKRRKKNIKHQIHPFHSS